MQGMSAGEFYKATVVGCLAPGELRILLYPPNGFVSRGAPRDVPMDLVPHDLRMPNSTLWVRLNPQREILAAWGGETRLPPATRLWTKAAFSSPLDLDAMLRENAYLTTWIAQDGASDD
jgi:hypothetical protein